MDATATGSLCTHGQPTAESSTEYASKQVMLRAERHDRIEIDSVVTRLLERHAVPASVTVVRRSDPYFGPKLLLDDQTSNYLLTAPGPDTQLLLWCGDYAEDGLRRGWQKLAEVTASLADTQPQYDLCPMCNEPLKTLEHEREAAFGMCPNAADEA